MEIKEGLIGPQDEQEKEIYAEESLIFEVQELIAEAIETKGKSQSDFRHLLKDDADLSFRQVAIELHRLGFKLTVSLTTT